MELSQWKTIYKNWSESGLTQIQYCKNKDYGYSTFQRKIQQMKEKGMLKHDQKNDSTIKITDKKDIKFIPIEVQSTNQKKTPYCEIQFEYGRIIIEDRNSFKQFGELIRMLVNC